MNEYWFLLDWAVFSYILFFFQDVFSSPLILTRSNSHLLKPPAHQSHSRHLYNSYLFPQAFGSNCHVFFIYISIWLCWALVVAHGIFSLDCSTVVACGNLVPWQGIKPEPPVLGAWSLSYWATREILPLGFQHNEFEEDTNILTTAGTTSPMIALHCSGLIAFCLSLSSERTGAAFPHVTHIY